MGTDLELQPGSVDVWWVPATLPAAAWVACLSPEERGALARLRFDVDARREAASRGARRLLLGRYLGVDPLALRFQRGPLGKPELAGLRAGTPLEFSASDSGDFALIAVAGGGQVGADVERWRTLEGDDIAARFFTASEQADLAVWPADRRQEGFFGLWTLKEAYVKGLGKGLSKPLDSFSARWRPGEPPRLENCDDSPAGSWTLWRVPAAPRYSAALAAQSPLTSYRLRTLDGPAG